MRWWVTSFHEFWNCWRIFIVNASLMTFKSFIIFLFIIVFNFSLRSKSSIWYCSFVWTSLMSESFSHWKLFTFVSKWALNIQKILIETCNVKTCFHMIHCIFFCNSINSLIFDCKKNCKKYYWFHLLFTCAVNKNSWSSFNACR